MNDKLHFAHLVIKYLSDETTESENEQLEQWMRLHPDNFAFIQSLDNEENVIRELRLFEELQKRQDQVWQEYFVQQPVLLSPAREFEVISNPRATKPAIGRKMTWLVAASLLVILSIAAYFFFNRKNDNLPPIADIWIDSVLSKNRIDTVRIAGKEPPKPRYNETTIKLSYTYPTIIKLPFPGSIAFNAKYIRYEFDSLQFDNVPVKKFDSVEAVPGKIYAAQLLDGTKVTLNYASSLKYLNNFADSTRTVELNGEAWFDVTKALPEKPQPFLVVINPAGDRGRIVIRVMGTKFNVQAYNNEKEVKITLLEGELEVTYDNKTVSVTPNKQLSITDSISKLEDYDSKVENVKAWQSSVVQYNQATISDIMRQVERWYNVQVTIDIDPNAPAKHYSGHLKRYSLDVLLDILKLVGIIAERTSETTIVVKAAE